jgi:hypothetical protein
MTPQDAALESYHNNPHGTEKQFRDFADCHFSETADVEVAVTIWRKLQKIAQESRQSEFLEATERMWPSSKGY